MIRRFSRSISVQSRVSILQTIDLTIRYGQIRAIDRVNLTVEDDEIVTLIGANGSGKSTLLKGVLGVQRSSQGKVLFRGRDITRSGTDRIVGSGIAMVPEGRGIVAEMSVMENLELGAFHRRDPVEPEMRTVLEWFPILAQRTRQLAGLLSGGEQQMLAVARAMMAKPTLIMMDEPSLGLAPIVVGNLFEIISRVNQQGQAILLAEQNARKALKIGHRGYVFDRGRIALEATCQELLKTELVRRSYLGG
jgi:branched-chain amino acid transport system ATP-binding protein